MGGASIQCFSFNLQGLAELSQTLSEADGVGVVSPKVLKFSSKGSIVLLSSSPVDRICMNSVFNKELFNTRPIRASSHGWVCMGMERPRMNGAAASLGCQEFRKGTVEVIGDEGGDGVLLAIGNDKEMASSGGVPVIAPSGSWKCTRLGTFWSRSGMFFVCRCIHTGDIELATTFIQDQGHVFNECFISNLSLDRVVFGLNKGLHDRNIVGGRGRENGGRRVGRPLAVGEFVKIIGRVVDGRRGVGDVCFDRGGDGRSEWRERKCL